ncbi:MAG: hypothetical protein ACOX2X_00175 [Peptococcia bacterium]
MKGLALGCTGAAINFLILIKASARMEKVPEKANATLGFCYLLRFAVSLGTLLIAFFCFARSTSFLVGVAFGLTIPSYFYFLYFNGRGKQNLERKE